MAAGVNCFAYYNLIIFDPMSVYLNEFVFIFIS